MGPEKSKYSNVIHISLKSFKVHEKKYMIYFQKMKMIPCALRNSNEHFYCYLTFKGHIINLMKKLIGRLIQIIVRVVYDIT